MGRGASILTYTGRRFHPFDPRVEDVCIEDIAHALSLQCRFAGHCSTFYSVAEHSVRGSYMVPGVAQLQFLLHDASEAYLMDVPSPLKRHGMFGWLYRRTERRVMRVIAEACRVPFPFYPAVSWADARMLVTERRDLCPHSKPAQGDYSDAPYAPYEARIRPLRPEAAERAFLARYEVLDRMRCAAITWPGTAPAPQPTQPVA